METYCIKLKKITKTNNAINNGKFKKGIIFELVNLSTKNPDTNNEITEIIEIILLFIISLLLV